MSELHLKGLYQTVTFQKFRKMCLYICTSNVAHMHISGLGSPLQRLKIFSKNRNIWFVFKELKLANMVLLTLVNDAKRPKHSVRGTNGTDDWCHRRELRYSPDWGRCSGQTMHHEWQRVIVTYSTCRTYQPPDNRSRSEFMRPFASVSVLSMANSFNCLLQATDSINNFFLLLLLLHNHVYCVNPCGRCDSLLLQMIKPCQNSTKETMNTKQGPADFILYISPKLSSVKTAEEGRRLDFSFFFSLLPSQQSWCPSGHDWG